MPLQDDRLAQLQRMSDGDIAGIIRRIRQAERIPQLDYHFKRHGREFGAATSAEYLQALRDHLSRNDLRIFTYIRASDGSRFWELISPESNATVLYNEDRDAIWSFFRMGRPDLRLGRYRAQWLEIALVPGGWRFERDWQWQT
jgi:hypothetical protein